MCSIEQEKEDGPRVSATEPTIGDFQSIPGDRLYPLVN